ncbi:1672_t:CDS:2, partial [Scutellospora calospora]
MSESSSQKRTRTAISDYLKREICKYSQSHPHVKQLDIANHFNSQDPNLNLDRTTISKILKDKSRWLAVADDQSSSITFRHKQVKYPLLNQAMKLWIEQVTRGEMIITELMIKEKATIFAKALNLGDDALKFSNGWIHKFKRRNNLRNFRLHGESNSAPLSLLPEYKKKLHDLIENYTLDNVFNADETGLFFRMAPDQTLASQSRPVIGSSISPRALFRINYDTLPVIYRANSRAWMRNDIFSEWLKDLDQRFCIQNRQVLLLVDNASSYFYDQSNIANINELRGSDELNVNSEEEIFDNNLEPEISTTLCGNRRGRGRRRVTTTEQDSSNSRSKRGNRGNRGSRGGRG